MSKTKVIIDCDLGVDDAVAIMMALASENIEIVAITSVFGNTSIENTTRNALRLLKYCNRIDIPVYKGCSSNLIKENYGLTNSFHGSDGFGGAKLEDVDPIDLSNVQEEPASAALCRLVSAQPGCITLVAIGPLTNIAIALMMDPLFGSKLNDFVVMGGSYMGTGNVSPTVEFNWHCDPEAAKNILASLNRSLTLIPLETCVETSPSLDWYEKAVSNGTRASKFIEAIEDKTIHIQNCREIKKFLAWDQLAMAVVANPDVITEVKEVYACVELHGQHTRGQLVADWKGKLGKAPNIKILTGVNQRLYEEVMLTAFNLKL